MLQRKLFSPAVVIESQPCSLKLFSFPREYQHLSKPGNSRPDVTVPQRGL